MPTAVKAPKELSSDEEECDEFIDLKTERIAGDFTALNPLSHLPLVAQTPSGHPLYYREGGSSVIFFCIHGAGLGAASFALLAREVSEFASLAALDLPGHGRSPIFPRSATEPPNLSRDVLLAACHEALLLLHSIAPLATVVLFGHSLGGALAAHLEQQLESEGGVLSTVVVGLVVADVVEGSARDALPFMRAFLSRQPPTFDSPDSAVRHVHSERIVRNLESARHSVPEQLVHVGEKWLWRVDLARSERAWPSWFEGLNRSFLACTRPKILLLAQADRMDKEMTIAQMQGRFKLVLLREEVGHILHEDAPRATAAELRLFLRQFRVPLGAAQQRELIERGCAGFRNGL